MRVGSLAGGWPSGETALRLLTPAAQVPGPGPDTPAAQTQLLQVPRERHARATSAAMAAIQDLVAGGATTAASAIADVRAWTQDPRFKGAAQGVADDGLRALVRNGKLPALPALDEAQWQNLSDDEKMVYGTVRTLQGLYAAQPKTLQQALADRVKTVLDGHPESIRRMQAGLADGTLKASDGWPGIIADYQAELDAARDGRMQIHAVSDPASVQAKEEFSVSHNTFGWSGRGITVTADFQRLQALYPGEHVEPGASPYTGAYVLTW